MNVRSCLIAPMLALLISLTVSATEISLCYEEWRPYAYKTSDGRFNGSVIERLKSAAKKHNVRLVFHELPHSRCILSVKGLKIDFALFVDETEHMPMLNNAVATWDLAIITRPGEMPTEQEKLTAHHIKQIIIARDYDYPKEVLNYFSSINKKVLEASYYIGNEKDVIRIFNLLLQKKAMPWLWTSNGP